MRRNNLWTYFLSLICAAILTLAFLPACGGGGSNESCNTPANQVEGQEAACDAEETSEETEAAAEEVEMEATELSGISEVDETLAEETP